MKSKQLPVCAGIDYSITSPAICVYSGISFSPSFEECSFLIISDKEPKEKEKIQNIEYISHPNYLSEIERFLNITNLTIQFLKHHRVKNVFLEGYSMGSKGKVFNIGENTGLLKASLFQNKIHYTISAPTIVKKFAFGKGNANKEQMWEAFKKRTNRDDLYDRILGEKKLNSPLTDIVDSYFILLQGLEGIKYNYLSETATLS